MVRDHVPPESWDGAGAGSPAIQCRFWFNAGHQEGSHLPLEAKREGASPAASVRPPRMTRHIKDAECLGRTGRPAGSVFPDSSSAAVPVKGQVSKSRCLTWHKYKGANSEGLAEVRGLTEVCVAGWYEGFPRPTGYCVSGWYKGSPGPSAIAVAGTTSLPTTCAATYAESVRDPVPS